MFSELFLSYGKSAIIIATYFMCVTALCNNAHSEKLRKQITYNNL